MKTQLTNSFNQSDKSENQVTIVIESMATEFNNGHGKTFSAAELWNIQKQHRSINQRRRSL